MGASGCTFVFSKSSKYMYFLLDKKNKAKTTFLKIYFLTKLRLQNGYKFLPNEEIRVKLQNLIKGAGGFMKPCKS